MLAYVISDQSEKHPGTFDALIKEVIIIVDLEFAEFRMLKLLLD